MIRENSRLRWLLVAMFTLFLLAPNYVLGQKPQTPNPLAPKATKAATPAEPSAGAATHELTASDVEAFLAGVMPLQLAREDIAGAVILIVKDGKVLFSQGYGYANVEKKIAVSPENTLFRPGSISKLFTWTAVMQLVEQGKLDLDRNVNDYLDFKIPDTYPKPITLRNIMTHTSGLEETVQELFVGDISDLKPLDVYLKEHLPTRIFPPGTTPAYSNFATTIAGYIVQRVSGQPFDDYIEQHILNPLKMSHCTFRQPLPEPLKPMMSNGYEVASEPAKPFEFVEAAPAGSSSVTAADMAHFMMAHLQDGSYEGVQILKPETAKLMHARQFENVPGMNAMALGFYEETRNGHRIIGHAGDTEYFHSDLHLVLDQNLGFFISYNSAGKGEISPREAVWQKFLDRYFPYQPPAPETGSEDTKPLLGRYLVSRRADDSIMKVLSAIGQAQVTANDDGTLSVNDLKDLNGEPKKFRRVAPSLYRDVNDQDLIGFKRDDSGNPVMAIDFPFMVFQKSPWYENSGLNLPVIIGSLVILLLAILLWPVSALIRRHYGLHLSLSPEQRRARLIARLVALTFLIFFGAFATFMSIAFKDIGLLSPRYNGWLRLIQLFGWLGVLGTVIVLYNAFRVWGQKDRWFFSRVSEMAIALACLGTIWFMYVWDMLHLSLKY